MIKLITLGSDPEVFVTKNGKPYPSTGLVEGAGKKNPKHIGDGFYVQEDNVMLEFNIPPSDSEDVFVQNIQGAIGRILPLIPDYGILVESSMEFDSEHLQTEKAFEFGCDPDFDAYSGEENPLPMFLSENLRHAGGHVHMGVEESLSSDTTREVVKAMDLFTAIPAILKDTDFLRRITYGKAGRYREKPYGLEYRSLSNFWIANEESIRWVYKNTHKAVDFVNSKQTVSPKTAGIVVRALENSDQKLAEKLIKEYNIPI